MHPAWVIAFIGALVFSAHLFVGMFSRTRVPDVLLLIVIGLVLGPLTHIVSPTSFGSVGPVFTTVTLVLILFESGIGLRVETLRNALRGTLILSTLNFIVTATVVTLLALKMAHLGIMRSMMLGATLGGTSPAVVIPMVAQLQMGSESAAILFLESAVGDVLSIVIALAILDGRRVGSLDVGPVAGAVLGSFLIASVIGILGAIFWSHLLSRMRTLQNGMFTTVAFVFLIFGATETLGYSGAIAALVFGIGLGNVGWISLRLSKKFPALAPVGLNDREKTFFAELVFLLKTFFFVYIGMSIQFQNHRWLAFGLVVALIIFMVRIPVVRFGVSPLIPQSDACRMAAMAPKGLAAAVLAAIPLQQGVPAGDLIQSSTYSVILFSIVLTSLLIFLQDSTSLGAFYRKIFAGFAADATLPGTKPVDVDESNAATMLVEDGGLNA